jgi:predicted Rossmann fold nucleotide-binding protein DprA/Smf involved in DNA uptake
MSLSVATPELQTITPHDDAYPVALTNCIAFSKPPTLSAIGTLNLLTHSSIALFCSVQCPSDLISKTYDLAQSFTDAGISLISGFQSPSEQACLKILLQGPQPVIHCPARTLHKIRLSPAQKHSIESDRLLLLSPFSASYSRATTELAEKRNEMIGAITRTILMTYAAPGSKTLSFAQRLIKAGKSVLTLDSPSNLLLQEQGITVLDADAIVQYCLSSQNSTSQ